MLSVPQFVAKWKAANLSERSSYQQHFLDLCQLHTLFHAHYELRPGETHKQNTEEVAAEFDDGLPGRGVEPTANGRCHRRQGIAGQGRAATDLLL